MRSLVAPAVSTQDARHVRALFVVAGLCSLIACGSRDGDPDSAPNPNSIGTGVHIRDVVDPAKNMNGATVSISGAVVLTIDTYDETADGKSRGTVYVQDIGSQAPFSGTSLYSPAFVPSDLRVVPGDTLDLLGQYVTESSIGAAVFNPGEVLPQVSKPTATFRYEYQTPDPKVIDDPKEFDDYNTGYQWENMLVTLKNVTLCNGLDTSKGRTTGTVASDCTSSGTLTMSNELMALDVNAYPPGTKFASLTGIATWFFSYHIAPRSAADIVLAQ